MLKISKADIEKERKLNLLSAENAQLRADLDYIQIMTGVEIPTTKEEHNEEMV